MNLMLLSSIAKEHAELIQRLETTGLFRVSRAIATPAPEPSAPLAGERVALIVDTETTGLDLVNDEIVEIGVLAFAYDEQDNYTRVIDIFDELQEPKEPMKDDAISITGITSAMLEGKRINISGLKKILDKSSLVIAHNAAFDRPMCEKLLPSFKTKAWACSATEIPWKFLGFEGAKLAYLLHQNGLFHNGHRALEDCYALLNILTLPQKMSSKCGLQLLLSAARETRVRIEAIAPFEMRIHFKNRGYRWKSYPIKMWYKDIPESDSEAELKYLRDLNSTKLKFEIKTITAFDRYKL